MSQKWIREMSSWFKISNLIELNKPIVFLSLDDLVNRIRISIRKWSKEHLQKPIMSV